MLEAPRVSVITTVYNGERFLAEAIESILVQTFTAFEYILVDDASTDRSPHILQAYAARDRRLVLVRNPANLQISASLNRGLHLARGEYVAILDQDDLAHPERLSRQVAFLDAQAGIGVLGTQIQRIDADGRRLRPVTFPTSPELSRWRILFGSPCQHSTVMLRRCLALQAGGYPPRLWWAADYNLLASLLRCTGITNLADTLGSLRCHPDQTSMLFSQAQKGQVWLLMHAMLVERLGLRLPLDQIGRLYHALRQQRLDDAGALHSAADLLLAIRERYLQVEQPDPTVCTAIDADCARRLLALARTHRSHLRSASRCLLRRARELAPRASC